MHIRNVLVIEGHPDVRDVVRHLLEWSGFRSAGAANMAEARTALDTSDIALIISDTGFPNDGDPTIAEEAVLRGVPLLMMSGRLERQEMYLQEGVPFLPKPFGLSALRQQVRLVIGGDEEEPGQRLELKSSQAGVLRTEQGHG